METKTAAKLKVGDVLADGSRVTGRADKFIGGRPQVMLELTKDGRRRHAHHDCATPFSVKGESDGR